MDAATCQFDTEQTGTAWGAQHAFLELVADAVRRVQPPEFGLAAINVTTHHGHATVVLPHRHNDECDVASTVSAEKDVVSYGD